MSGLDRAAIERVQWERLSALLNVLRTDNPFYSPRLREAGDVNSLAEFREKVPFTWKRELGEDQVAYPPFGTNLTYPVSRYTRFCQTSATTGAPLRWLDTPESWSAMVSVWKRVFAAAGVTTGDRILFSFSFGPFLGFWTAFDAATEIGCLAIPAGGMSSSARLRALLDTQATVLCCTPTYAIRLAGAAAEHGFDLTKSAVRRIVVAGEPGGSVPGTRAHLESLWPGAKVADHHGMTETGPVSYECPLRPGVLHVVEEEFVAEIVGPANELVLTNLSRGGSPVLRFRTLDMVRPLPPGRCLCGTEELALEGGILGRVDDMVVIRGVNVYPGAIENLVRSCGGVEEYRVEVATVREMVELRLQVEGEPDAAHRLEVKLKDSLALRIPVELVPPGTLPRFEMKAKRWIKV